MKSILIESTAHKVGSLKLIESRELSSNPKYSKFLGIMKGPAADFINPTRNDRHYSRKLWDNVVSSDIFKEGLATLTILGELDHPEERLDTEIKQAAITLLDYVMDDASNTMICTFGILDTPNGHIVKNLLDSGVQLGVSSRGQGDIVGDEVDPDSYLFIAFDVVALPAVIKARPAMVSEGVSYSVDSNAFTESINRANSKQELEIIKKVISNTGLPDTSKLVECIDTKLVKLSSSEGNTIASQLIQDLASAYAQIDELKAKLATPVVTPECSTADECDKCENDENHTPISNEPDHIDSVIPTKDNNDTIVMTSTVEQTCDPSSEFVEQLTRASSLIKFYKNKVSVLNRKLKESTEACTELRNQAKLTESAQRSANESLIANLKSKLVESTDVQEELLSKLSRANASFKRLSNKYSMMESKVSELNKAHSLEVRRIKESYESKLRDKDTKYADLKKVSQFTIDESAKQLSSVSSQLANLTESVAKSKQAQTESLKLAQASKKETKRALESYLSVKAKQTGLSESVIRQSLPSSYSAKDIDNTVKSLAESKLRLSSLPFSLNESLGTSRIVESVESSHIDPADQQTISFLDKVMANR